jgi:hypothetical protein
MKTNHRIIVAIALVSASIGCAHAQTRTVAPTAEPAPDQPSAKNYQSRLSTVVTRAGAAPATANQYGYSSRSSSSSDSVPPVVIQFGTKEPGAIATMEEDLAVMTHIIDRAVDRVGEDEPPSSLGVRLYYTSGGRSVRALYLDGFGALIMVKVNFPVHAPTAVDTKAPENAEDSEWERARRALYGVAQEAQWNTSSSAVPYDAARVDGLKKHLIDALKNASNIKGVRPDEYVSVTIFGSPGVAVGAKSNRSVGQPEAGNSLPVNVVTRGLPSGGAAVAWASESGPRIASEGTVLTLRAKKSDIDAAEKGTLDADAFAKKVTVSTYFGNGHGLKSVNSWIRSSSSSMRR